MYVDPLMPACRRFPRDAALQADAGGAPSRRRPFVLRGAHPGGVAVAKHRTPATTRRVSQTTTSDGKSPTTKTDYYNTPDD
jgi:hypothetical protein